MSNVKKVNEENQEEKMKKYNFVVYTDGSGLLEYRTWGLGFIGYSYEVKDGKDPKNSYKPDKSLIKKLNPTNLGFVTKELIAEDPMYSKSTPVEVDKILYGFKEGDIDNTNNFAEASAVKEVFNIIKTEIDSGHEVNSIMIKTDSQMVVTVMTSLWNSEKDFDYNRFAYPELYKTIHELMKFFKSKNVKFSVLHVYGHSSSLGNHIADRLAFVGRNLHTTRKMTACDETGFKYILENASVLNDEFEEYENGPMLKQPFNRLFFPLFNGNMSRYNVMEYAKNDKDMGTRNPSITFGFVKEDDPDKTVEAILNSKEADKIKDEYFHLLIQNLNKPIPFLMLKLGESVINFKNKALRILDDVDILVMSEPSGLIRQQLDRYIKTDMALDAYEHFKNNKKKVNNSEIVDLTDKFFKVDKDKVKCVIKHNEEDFKVTTKMDGHDFEHVVKFKSFLPVQKYFRDFEKGYKDIKCYFLTILVSKNEFKKRTSYLFDDYFIVDAESSDGKRHLSVWCNFYSGRTINIV